MEKGFLNPDTFSQKYQWTTQDLKVCYMCLSNSDGTPVYTIINLNRSYRPCRRKLANEHDQSKFSLYPSFELVPFVVWTKTNCERDKIIMIRRLNLNKSRNKICTFIHLLCLMNIKKQPSLGKFKSNLNQTPMPPLFCKPLNWKAQLSHAEETLANQHDRVWVQKFTHCYS